MVDLVSKAIFGSFLQIGFFLCADLLNRRLVFAVKTKIRKLKFPEVGHEKSI